MDKDKVLYQGKRIVLFGIGDIGVRVLSLLQSIDNPPFFITDNNPKLWGITVEGIKVSSVNDIFELTALNSEEYVFLICSKYIEDITKQIIDNLGETVLITDHNNLSKDIFEGYASSNKQIYHVDYEKDFTNWTQDILSEVEFWFNMAKNEKGFIEHLYGGEKNINSYPYFQKQVKEHDTVLDVGCGLVSFLGNKTADNKAINLIAVDPLAKYYRHIIDMYSEQENKEEMYSQFGLFEFLSHKYGEEYADVILVSNSLDHCIDPIKGLLECLKVLKRDEGELLLFHFKDEGKKANYGGLHKWNLCARNGELVIWNLQNYININKLIEDFAAITVEEITSKNLLKEREATLVRIKKTKEFNAEELLKISDKARMMVSIEELISLCCDDGYCKSYLELIK